MEKINSPSERRRKWSLGLGQRLKARGLAYPAYAVKVAGK